MAIEATVIESSVTDRVFLSKPLSEAFSSSGASIIAPGDFVRANNTTTKTPAILKAMISILYPSSPYFFFLPPLCFSSL